MQEAVSKASIFNPQLTSFDHIEQIYTRNTTLQRLRQTLRSKSQHREPQTKNYEKVNLRGTSIRFGKPGLQRLPPPLTATASKFRQLEAIYKSSLPPAKPSLL